MSDIADTARQTLASIRSDPTRCHAMIPVSWGEAICGRQLGQDGGCPRCASREAAALDATACPGCARLRDRAEKAERERDGVVAARNRLGVLTHERGNEVEDLQIRIAVLEGALRDADAALTVCVVIAAGTGYRNTKTDPMYLQGVKNRIASTLSPAPAPERDPAHDRLDHAAHLLLDAGLKGAMTWEQTRTEYAAAVRAYNEEPEAERACGGCTDCHPEADHETGWCALRRGTVTLSQLLGADRGDPCRAWLPRSEPAGEEG